MGDGVGGAGLDAVTAENAAIVVDVVDLGVALGRGDSDGLCVLGGLDVDAVRGAGCGAEKAGDTLLQAILVTLKLMLAAEALLELCATHGTLAVGIVLDFSGLEHLLEGDAHSFGNGGCVADDRHSLSIRRGRYTLEDMKRPANSLSCMFGLGFLILPPAFANAQTGTSSMDHMAEHTK